MIDLQTVDLHEIFHTLYHQFLSWISELLSFLDHIVIMEHLSMLRLIIILLVVGLVIDALIVIIPTQIENE